MAARIDLLIRQSANTDESLQVFVSAPGSQNAFAVAYPARLQSLQLGWRQRFLRHHDPAFDWGDGAAAVGSWSERLLQGLEQWLTEPEWQPLQTLLTQLPDMPLALRFEGPVDGLGTLPWQALRLQRPIWRVESQAPVALSKPARIRARKPRIVLLVGSEHGLNLDTEVGRLMQLKKDRRIDLRLLRGPSSSAPALRSALADTAGWDALLYLGHSSSGPDGGLLHLGDGSQLSGKALEKDWALATSHGLRLLLFNSCSGLPLAQQAVRAGVDWTVCFLEPVPAKAAAIAFEGLLQAMEAGSDLIAAIAAARTTLESSPECEGCSLLLTAVAASGAAPFRLPLRRRRQFWLRLAQSNRRQAIALGLVTAIGFAMELAPANPVSTYLLDRRLLVQRSWRQVPVLGPWESRKKVPAIAVLLLDPDTTIPALGAKPEADHTSRRALAAVLQRSPVDQVPVIGLDVVFDRDRPGTRELADVIARQRQRRVVAGYIGPYADGSQLGSTGTWFGESRLAAAGLQVADLAVGTAAGAGPIKKPVPLYLHEAITKANFAGALATPANPVLPADRVIDWSLNWAEQIQLVKAADLPQLRTPLLLVGSSGRLGDQSVDLFSAPAPVEAALRDGEKPLWSGSAAEVPGVLVQAVLIQSLNNKHWLTPISLTLCTLSAGALGILLAALLEKRQHRWVAIALLGVASCPLSFSLAVTQLVLLPLLLPLLALTATTFSRDD